MSGRRSAVVLGSCAAVALTVSAQQSQPPPQQPIFRAEANYVRLDVFVTAGGAPVEDLTQDDFEVLEDSVPQRIETFERVKIGGAMRTAPLADPNSQREGNDRAADPRRRVFVIFLDTYHVGRAGSLRANQALVRFLDQLLAPEDLIGVMKPEMDVDHLMLGHKVQVIQGGLSTAGMWGLGEDSRNLDAVEQQYLACFPEGLAEHLIARRREKLTLDALRDLVRHLYAIREERKAVIVVSEGWYLFRPDERLMAPVDGAVPGRPSIHVGPGGRISTRDPRSYAGATAYDCDRDRLMLAGLDNEAVQRELVDEANRSNVAFYPVNVAGLVAPSGPAAGLTIFRGRAIQFERQDSLRALATATDGLAVVNTNDLAGGLRKVVTDLSFYYLLGYHSTNTALDGKFRSIKVRVKRPGVEIRARRGYRAATREELTADGTPDGSVVGSASHLPAALSAALGRLGQIRPDATFRLHAIALRAGTGARVFLAGELEPAVARSAAWAEGGEVTLMAEAAGSGGGAGRATIAPGARGFSISVAVDGAAADGEIQVQARLRPRSPDGQPTGDVVIVRAPAAGAFLSNAPLLFRLFGGTAAAPQPAADFRFNRTERVRLELPVAGEARSLAGRVLDRAGRPLPIPVSLSERTDERGTRWVVADVTLAQLYSGDYAVEIGAERAGARETVVTAIRVVR